MTRKEKKLHLTGVWQNGGRSAKLSICTSINISANLNICTTNPPLRQAPKRYIAILRLHFDTLQLNKIGFVGDFLSTEIRVYIVGIADKFRVLIEKRF